MRRPSFRSQFDSLVPLFGTFVKTPDIAVVEVLANSSIDFIVLDQEHAPFDRGTLDDMLFAAVALDLPALVRVPNAEPSTILPALDGGANGVMLPHILDAAGAERGANACRYRSGRGYSGAVRAMRGAPSGSISDKTSSVDAQVVVVAQIEDEAAVPQSDAVAGVEGVDALFIGRGDLAVSMGTAKSDVPEVWEASRTIAKGAAGQGKPSWAFAGSWTEADQLLALGVRGIVFGSDQALLQHGVGALTAEAYRRIGTTGNA